MRPLVCIHSLNWRNPPALKVRVCLRKTEPHVWPGWRVYHVMKMKQPFDMAVKQYGDTVLRVCRAVLGPGMDADDAWSETFLAALKSWPELPEDTNVEAWLVRVAHRKAIDITRARTRRAVPTAVLPEAPSTRSNPDHDEVGMWAAVAALPERQRLAIAYYYLGGLPHTETAEIIGGSPEAVRRAASDGIKNLRQTFSVGQPTKGVSS